MTKAEYIENYYRSLSQKLIEQVNLLEKKLNAKKEELKKKTKLDPVGKEDEDLDNDGKPNTKADKYLKNRRAKIKAAMMSKKSKLSEGRIVGNDIMHYGGFPKVLTENTGAVSKFNDADDPLGSGDERIATHPDQSEPITWQFTHNGMDYPSQTMVDFQKALDQIGGKLNAVHETFRSKYGPIHYEKQMMADPTASALVRQWQSVGNAMRAHPHFAELVKGHPSKRRELTPSELDRLYKGD